MAVTTAAYHPSYSQLGRISATYIEIVVDSVGQYSDIEISDDGNGIALVGNKYTYPNCLAYSPDFGESWKTLDYMEKPNFTFQYTHYYSDFVKVSFLDNNNLFINSHYNRFYKYNIDTPRREEYIVQNITSLNDARNYDFITMAENNGRYFIYSRSEGGTHYDDNSTIVILDPIDLSRKIVEFNMETLAELTEPRGKDRWSNPSYDDELVTSDGCFLTTIAHYSYNENDSLVPTRSLAKIKDFDNPEWELLPFSLSDPTAQHFIYFDDSDNGIVSTYNEDNKFYPRMYRTTDGGNSWAKIYEDNEKQYVPRDFKRLNDSTLFARSSKFELYRSTDNGSSWFRIESGITKTLTGFEIIDKNNLLVAYNQNTIAKITLGSVISNIEDSGNSNFGNSAYPNPATNTVNIDLTPDQFIKASKSEITVYDVIGNEINTNGEIRIENNKVVWDCSTKPSGVYIIRIDEEIYKVIKE